jgi:hypothetical protein
MERIGRGTVAWLAMMLVAACSSDESSEAPVSGATGGTRSVVVAGSSGSAAGAGGLAGSSALTAGRAAAGRAAPLPAGGGAMLPAGSPAPIPTPPAAGTAAAPPVPPTAGAAPGAPPPPPAAGPEDGDPSAPVIAVPNVACGPGRVLGIGMTNVMVGGRGVHVTYPCNKHKGAPATIFLNLHGTMPNEAQKLYQVGYFSAHTLVNSHNLIMVAPKAVGSQWGREDGGADIPHLMEVIEWAYATFKDFDIRSLWVGGHSWGGGFTASFGCRPELADRVKGLVLMSGGSVTSATCSSKVSLIITMAEGDGRMPSDQMALATSHGCQPAKSEMILMNNHTSWPMCQPGFVHANYYMLGKEHATFMDAEVVKSIADWIKLARP